MDREHEVQLRIRTALGFSRDAMKTRSASFASVVLAEWSALARSSLNTSRQAYLNSLQVRNVTDKGFIVGLPASASTATLALMVELGMGSGGIGTTGEYDVRTYLLRNSTRNIRKAKNGSLYLHVPFSQSAKSVEAKHGSNIAKQMAQLAPTISMGRGRTVWGGKFPAKLVKKMKSHHRSDPLAGAVRLQSTYSHKKKAVVQTTGYRTFRTASYKNKDPKAWKSKGIKPRYIGRTVANMLPELYERTFSSGTNT